MDFVLCGPKGLLAFEIKRTSRITPALTGGLCAFLTDYPMAKASLVYMGTRRLFEGEIPIIPVEDALRELPALLNL